MKFDWNSVRIGPTKGQIGAFDNPILPFQRERDDGGHDVSQPS